MGNIVQYKLVNGMEVVGELCVDDEIGVSTIKYPVVIGSDGSGKLGSSSYMVDVKSIGVFNDSHVMSKVEPSITISRMYKDVVAQIRANAIGIVKP